MKVSKYLDPDIIKDGSIEGDKKIKNYPPLEKGSGENSIVQKDGGNIASGKLSFAYGYETKASGFYSHAEGYHAIASSSSSHAEGYYTTASGAYSHAEGRYTTASAYDSHAEGYGTTTSGERSHAEGYYTTASGSSSHSEGDHTTASGSSSHSEGDHTTASGIRAHAEGYSTTASGPQAHAEGYRTTASGSFGSHSEGYLTISSGDYGSHAEGYSTTASGSFSSHSEGYLTTASGDYGSHAEGYSTTASGSASHAEGLGNMGRSTFTVIGEAGTITYTTSTDHGLKVEQVVMYNNVYRRITSIPSNTSFTVDSTLSSDALNEVYIYIIYGGAYGDYSHVEGLHTQTINLGEHAEGKYNKSIKDKTIHTVGIGTSDNGIKNAHEIHTDGKHYIIGIGSYDGTNSQTEGIKTLQEVIKNLEARIAELENSFVAITDEEINGLFAV